MEKTQDVIHIRYKICPHQGFYTDPITHSRDEDRCVAEDGPSASKNLPKQLRPQSPQTQYLRIWTKS